MASVKAVILAGGSGTRFWPLSRMQRPKQFLSLSPTGPSLIALTAQRVEELCGKDGVWVVTNKLHRELVEQHVPEARVYCEPVGRNTTAPIGWAALHLLREDPDGVMIVLPADHVFEDEEALRATLVEAIEIAGSERALVTIGITPSHPHTGYGYIKHGEELRGSAFKLDQFVEKPDPETAQGYLNSGQYYWNSGMFVWRADVILEEIKRHLPELHAGLMQIDQAIGSPQEQAVAEEVFPTLEAISIDYGVMERASECVMVAGKPFGWNDVGSWDQWAEQLSADECGNVTLGDVMTIDSKNCIVNSEQRLTVVLGAEDIVVINSGDAVLVCPRNALQDVKKVVALLKEQGRNELL